ncbi:protein translocase subunit SecD [Algihabitans sp.]|uniref:protein translocase subunit SecD n=1 Tax=Algihabitans sp. TaxID=2821514 RepID=UPI003BAC1E63
MVQFSRWQVVAVLVVVLLGFAFASPNLLPRQISESLPSWLPNQQISLGLDLQGGSSLLLEVDMETVFEEELDNLVDTVRSELRQERIGYTGLRSEGDSVFFTLRDPAQAEAAREALLVFTGDALLRISDSTGEGEIELTAQVKQERQITVLQQSIEIVRRRIDELGTREPAIQRQGEERILVQVPGVENPERLIDLLGQTAQLSFRMVNSDVQPGLDPVPPGSELLPMEDDGMGASQIVVRKRILVSGENLTDAQPTFQDGEPVVSFRFDSTGAQRFGQVTQENVGRPFAIVLDEAVISAPVIREPILGGSGVISGSFSVQEAQDLALLLRAGALPAPLTVIEQRSVGPGLGADSIRAGEFAAVLGLLLVIVFMGSAYGLFGLFANVALIINLILLAAALSGLQATLTLPGIAGIVLTIGMAVDANVLIFERIREEARLGRGPVSAIDAGYKRAITTIIDSNLTTLIAALLLFQFGSGPIRGFAVTLAIGILTSMFTAIMVTRLLVVTWLRRRRTPAKALPI